jgi:hypothetical protein
MYDHQWYIGKVIEVDEEDRETNISFMKNTSARPITVQWPSNSDKLLVSENDILCGIEEPLPRGKSKRQFTLNEETVGMIRELFLKNNN